MGAPTTSPASWGSDVRNPDLRRRGLYRRAAQGDLDAAAQLLVEQLRIGEVTQAGVEALACFKDPAALRVMSCPDQGRVRWSDSGVVRANGPVYAVLIALACGEFAMPLVLDPPGFESRPSAVPGSILMAVRSWLRGQRRGCYRAWGSEKTEWTAEGWPPDEPWYEEIAQRVLPRSDACFWPGALYELGDQFQELMAWTAGAGVLPAQYIPYLNYLFRKIMRLVAQADWSPRAVPKGEGRGRLEQEAGEPYDMAVYHVVQDTLNAASLAVGERVRSTWLNRWHPGRTREPPGSLVHLSPYGHNYSIALKQHVLKRVRPWILSGSPELWDAP